MKAKPPIHLARSDPFASPAALHFEKVRPLPSGFYKTTERMTSGRLVHPQSDPRRPPHHVQLFHKYGQPVVVVNLVKRKEKRLREGKLTIGLT